MMGINVGTREVQDLGPTVLVPYNARGKPRKRTMMSPAVEYNHNRNSRNNALCAVDVSKINTGKEL